MVIQFRGNRIQCLAADSLPTTGVTNNYLAELCDTNVWKYFVASTSTWTTFPTGSGINTLNPIFVVPGDVSVTAGHTENTNLTPYGNWPWMAEGAAGGVYGEALPYQAILSTQPRPQGILVGQKLFISDTSTTVTWNGLNWA